MNASLKAAIVAIAGVLLFGTGVWMNHLGIGMGIAGVSGFQTSGFGTGAAGESARMAGRGAEYIAVAQYLLWCGGALVVLASASWLFLCTRPVWQN